VIPAYVYIPPAPVYTSSAVQNVDPLYELVTLAAVVLAVGALIIGWVWVKREMAFDDSPADNSAGVPSIDSQRG
jgi:hypothetical protein